MLHNYYFLSLAEAEGYENGDRRRPMCLIGREGLYVTFAKTDMTKCTRQKAVWCINRWRQQLERILLDLAVSQQQETMQSDHYKPGQNLISVAD